MSELIITHSDAIAHGYCNRVSRPWCKQHGFDWYEFRHHGVSAEALEATGDAMAIRLCRLVRDGRKI